MKVHELSSLNIPYINRNDLLACVSNLEQIMPQLHAVSGTGNSHVLRAVTRIQTQVRKWLAKLSFRHKTQLKRMLEKIQAQIR